MAKSLSSRKIEDLLGDLSLESRRDERSTNLQKELTKSGFKIFTPLSDHGYFGWQPQGVSYKVLSTVKNKEEIIDHINLDSMPPQLVAISALRLPQAFRSLPPHEHENKFPYGRYDIGCLYVASKHRQVDMDKVDFAFGGSTLEMLATKDASSPYMATRVPGTSTVLVAKCKDYIQNYADFGFQFERLVTGKSTSDRPDIEFVEHLHLMQVGKHRVLFRAEVDAMKDGEPVEVKASNPRYWGTKVMFQMISSGSSMLCHGVKGRGVLSTVRLLGLSEVATDALYHARRESLEENILTSMSALEDQMSNARAGETFKVSFSGGSMRLLPATTRNAVLLPPANVVKELV